MRNRRFRHTRVDYLLLAEKVPSWIESLQLPQLSEINGDIKALDSKVDSFEKKIKADIKVLETKIDAIGTKMDSEFKTV